MLDEIEFLISKYGFKEIQFIDDNLTLDRVRAKEIFEGMIKRNFNIEWTTPNGIAVWTLDEEMLEIMKASGCYELTVAFESGVQEVINNIVHKPLKLDYAIKMVNQMKKLNIQVHSFFMCGLPGETIEQIKQTFAFANRLDLDSAWFFCANPTPGSKLYDICLEKGYLDPNFSFENIEYNFAHITTEDFTKEEVERIVQTETLSYTLRSFFFHPKKFIKKYFSILFFHPKMTLRSFFGHIRQVLKLN